MVVVVVVMGLVSLPMAGWSYNKHWYLLWGFLGVVVRMAADEKAGRMHQSVVHPWARAQLWI